MSPMLYFVFMLAQSIDAHIVDGGDTQSLNFATAGYAVATAPQAAKSILQGIFGIIAVTENPCGNALQPLPKPHKNRCKSITFHLSFSSLYFVSHRVNALHPIL